jgi:hypothetical protein
MKSVEVRFIVLEVMTKHLKKPLHRFGERESEVDMP